MTTEGPPKHVIVGVDEGARSDEAIRAALDMHRRFQSRLELVHAIDIPRPEDVAGNPLSVSQMEAEVEAATFDRLSGHVRELFEREAIKDVQADDVLEVLCGHPSRVLLERAAAESVDMILLGPHEKRAVLDFGSTARAVLSKTKCNVWTQPGEYRPIQRILVPIDLSEDSLNALKVAREWAQKLSASVTTLHCFLPPELAYAPAGGGYPVPGPTYVVDDVRESAHQEFNNAMESFDWGGIEHDSRFVEGRPVATILDMHEEFDLVTMGSHGRTGLSAVVLGNVAYGVLKSSTKPVLAIRGSTRKWLL